MLLRWIGISKKIQHLQRRNQLGTGIARLDHFVDITASGGNIGIGKLFYILGDQFLAPFFWVPGSLDLILEENIYRALRAHHRDLRRGPGIVNITAHMLAIHHVICAAISLARNHRDLWHGRFAISIEQLGAVADNALCSWLKPGKKPGTSTNVIMGILKQSQKRTKRAPLSDELISTAPASAPGC